MNHLPRPDRGRVRLTIGGRAERVFYLVEREALVAAKGVNLGNRDLHELVGVRSLGKRGEPRQCRICSVDVAEPS